MARTLEMQRATSAWEQVQAVQAAYKDDATGRKKLRGTYGARVRDLGAMIMTDSLGQTLAYLRAKGKTGQPPDPHKPDQLAHRLLVEHLSIWVVSVLEGTPGTPVAGDHLLKRLLAADLAYYRRATVETLAYGIWLKKFVEAEFGDDINQVEATAGSGE